ncbi:MAG: TlpA family protein disulfide reductase [Endomicrobia bacterium]|nr:TlpA family protein disulfide reductase [Endomicrobiia bacterium]
MKSLIYIFIISLIFLNIIESQTAEKYKYIDFDLPTISTSNIKLSKIVGNKLILINFWTTWCPYCLNEIPKLNTLYEKYKEKGLEIIGINIKEPEKIVKKFVEEHKIKYNIALDKDGSIASYYKIKGIPTNFVINFSGEIIFAAHILPKEDFIINHLPKPTNILKNVKPTKKNTKK